MAKKHGGKWPTSLISKGIQEITRLQQNRFIREGGTINSSSSLKKLCQNILNALKNVYNFITRIPTLESQQKEIVCTQRCSLKSDALQQYI